MSDRPFAILPYGTKFDLRLARVPLDKLIWPFGRPAEISGSRVGDLPADFDLVCYPSDPLFFLPWPGVRARVSVLIVEPSAVQRRYYRWLILLQYRLRFIFTREAAERKLLKNAVFFNFPESWVTRDRTRKLDKTANLSLIASAKRGQPGHKLRHDMVDWLRTQTISADILGRGYKPFKDKAEGLAPYRFSVVIENSQEPHYYTEKLLDAVLCKTVPIYWGDPLIAEVFDPRGMILCNSLAELQQAVRKADAALYQSMLPCIEKNFETAMARSTGEARMAEILAGKP